MLDTALTNYVVCLIIRIIIPYIAEHNHLKRSVCPRYWFWTGNPAVQRKTLHTQSQHRTKYGTHMDNSSFPWKLDVVSENCMCKGIENTLALWNSPPHSDICDTMAAVDTIHGTSRLREHVVQHGQVLWRNPLPLSPLLQALCLSNQGPTSNVWQIQKRTRNSGME